MPTVIGGPKGSPAELIDMPYSAWLCCFLFITRS
jgi:hypothetical protein